MLRINNLTVFPYKEKRKVLFAVMRGRNVLSKGFASPEAAAKWIREM